MIDKIEKKILADADRQCRGILKKAEEERAEKTKEATVEIDKEKSRLLAKGRQEADRERQRVISEANLEAKRKLLATKEELINSVLGKAGEKIEAHTREKGYSKTLETLAGECREELGKDIELYVRQEDVNLLKGSHKREMGPGIIGESKNGGLYFDNTLEMRLKRRTEGIRKEIGSMLFKKAGSKEATDKKEAAKTATAKAATKKGATAK